MKRRQILQKRSRLLLIPAPLLLWALRAVTGMPQAERRFGSGAAPK